MPGETPITTATGTLTGTVMTVIGAVIRALLNMIPAPAPNTATLLTVIPMIPTATTGDMTGKALPALAAGGAARHVHRLPPTDPVAVGSPTGTTMTGTRVWL